VARGTTGAPRNTPGEGPGVRASGEDTGTSRHEQTLRVRPRGVSRLVAIICGHRSKYLVVAFWILVVAALGSLAGKLQGAEKNDSSAYLPSSRNPPRN